MAEEAKGEGGVKAIAQVSDLNTGPSGDEIQGEEHESLFPTGCVCGTCT